MILFVLAQVALTQGANAAEAAPVNSLTSEEMLLLGERMYRQGILPNGEPMQAMVSADVPVDGDMFTCVNCHQRSGLGSVEASIITWPVRRTGDG